MLLPDYYLITPEPKDQTRFLNSIQRQLDRGITLLRLRAVTLSLSQYQDLAAKVIALAQSYDAGIMLSGDIHQLSQLNTAGIHLTSGQLSAFNERPLGQEKCLMASCHNEYELRQAEKLQVDGVTLSPVLPTQSHPDSTYLGWQRFAALCQQTKLPVYALGGLRRQDLAEAQGAGAVGIAGISLFEF